MFKSLASRLFLSNTLLKSLKKETPLVSMALTAVKKFVRSNRLLNDKKKNCSTNYENYDHNF